MPVARRLFGPTGVHHQLAMLVAQCAVLPTNAHLPCAHHNRCCCTQGSKRKLEMAEKRANGTSTKKWNAGAPLSKKSKGLGKHKGENGRFVAVGEKPRDASLPTSVPMPSAIDDITDGGMRAMWEKDGSHAAAPATVPVMVSWGGAAEEVVEAQVA